jgi:hypothetical protein
MRAVPVAYMQARAYHLIIAALSVLAPQRRQRVDEHV